jgi:hypothetical protein
LHLLASQVISEGDGTRTRNHRIDSPATPDRTTLQDNDLRRQALALTLRLHADPDLTRIIDAWPDLPAHIKAAVLALVGTAR